MRTGTIALVAMLCGIGFFVPIHALKALAENGIKKTPSYAGFAEGPAAKNHFAVLGDTQETSHWEFWRERNDRERKLILDEITHRKPAFVINLGDLTARGSSTKHWQKFDDKHRTFREEKIPYFPILGNHEFYGNDKKALENYFGRFPHLGQRRWYSFTWRNVGLVMTDSNFSELTWEQREEQSRWYSAEIEHFEKMAGIGFIIVCSHEPPFTNSRIVPPNKEVLETFVNPFLQFRKTRLFLSGHNHSYERFEVKDKFFIVSGGGGGPRYKVHINSRKQRAHDLFSGPELRFFHFCEIECRSEGLVFRVLRLEPNGNFEVADAFIMPTTER